MDSSSLLRSSPQPRTNVFLFNLVILSLSFFLCFTAFSGIQNLESSLDLKKVSGSTAVAILYVTLTISCLSGPKFVTVLGPKMCIFIQEIFFAIFIATQIYPLTYTVYPAAALVGFGASALWVGQGDYVSFLSLNHARSRGMPEGAASGLFQGIFFGFMQMSQVSGNLISSLLLHKGGNDDKPSTGVKTLLFVVYLVCIGAAAVLLLFGLKSKKALEQTSRDLQLDSAGEDQSNSKKAEENAGLIETLKLFANPRMLFLVPLFILNGVESGFAWGDLTNTVIKETLGEANIGFVMVAFGAFDASFSLLLGHISDKIGRPLIVSFGFLCHLGCSVAILVWWKSPASSSDATTGDWVRIVAVAAVWGIGDAVWNTIISAMLSPAFPSHTAAAFGNFKMAQSAGVSVAFFYSKHVSLHGKLWIVIALVILSAVCYGANMLMFGLERKSHQRASIDNS